MEQSKIQISRVFFICVWVFYAALRKFVLFIDNIIYIGTSRNYVQLDKNTVEFRRSLCYQDFLLCLENLRRVPSISSISSASGSVAVLPNNQDGTLKPDFDTVSIESCGLSPMALQNIREALALSLERTKLLERQVKLIPNLQVGAYLI